MISKRPYQSAIMIMGLSSLASVAFAGEPPAGVPEEYIQAGEVIIDVANTMSEPFYNGDYYTTSTRPEGLCEMVRTEDTYNKDGELLKTVVTTYDLTLIDPSTVEPDPFGGVRFFTFGQEPVIHQEATFGGEYEAQIPGDSISVEDDATETRPLADAIKYLVEYCVAMPATDSEAAAE